MTERGLVPAGFIEEITRRYESEIGPMNGAKVVARAWVDPSTSSACLLTVRLRSPSSASAVRKAITWWSWRTLPRIHNVIVCTLCSCYPWPVLGLPPAWYKDPPYRARMVREPRTLLAEMGCPLPDDVEVRVWDSSAEVRYLVLPERPPGTEGMTEAELADLVTRDSMIGAARL